MNNSHIWMTNKSRHTYDWVTHMNDRHDTFIHMWHNTFVHVCDVTHSYMYDIMHPYVWHNTFIHVCDMAHSYICDITHSYMRTLTHPYTCMCDVFIYVWHNLTHPCICMCDVFIYVWRTHPHVCDVWHDTIICVRHDTLLRVMWCSDTRDITHAFVWHDAFISVKCRICMLKLIERNPRPRGGFLFTIFPHQEPCVRGTPPKDLYQVLRGGTSYTRFLMRGHSK